MLLTNTVAGLASRGNNSQLEPARLVLDQLVTKHVVSRLEYIPDDPWMYHPPILQVDDIFTAAPRALPASVSVRPHGQGS